LTSAFRYLLKKEFLILFRDKPALLYAFLMPIFLLMLIIPLYTISFTATLNIVDQDGGAHAKNLADIFTESKSIKVLPPEERALVTVTIPKGFSRSVSETGVGDLKVTYDNTRKIQAEAGLLEVRKAVFSFYADIYKERGIPQQFNQSEIFRFLITPVFEQRTKPENILALIMQTLKVSEKPQYEIKGRELALLPYNLPVIIAGIMSLFALVLAPYSIIQERKVGIYERLFTLPMKTRDVILSKTIVISGIILFQAIAIMMLLSNFYGFYVGGPMTVLAVALLGFANAALSIFLSVASKTVLQIFQLVGVAFVLQMLMMGGADVQVIGGLGAALVNSLPAIQGRDLIGVLMLKDVLLVNNMIYLLLFGLAATALSIFLFTKIKPSR